MRCRQTREARNRARALHQDAPEPPFHALKLRKNACVLRFRPLEPSTLGYVPRRHECGRAEDGCVAKVRGKERSEHSCMAPVRTSVGEDHAFVARIHRTERPDDPYEARVRPDEGRSHPDEPRSST
jgi:hypothetical protein